jgi:UDP-GlcNAc3NAcA epimerase
MKKIVSVVGARPQFVKAAVVSEQLRRAGVEEVMIHTGQHYDANMSDAFFEALGIPEPRYNLGIGGGTHGEMTGRQLIEIERRLLDEKPQAVLVYGDTNSTLAGALAAVKLHIPLAHVEAGLRSFNTRMPEEINRIVTDRISAVLFTPSRLASDNLRAEGVPDDRIVEVGDVMYDAALRYGNAPAAAGDGRPFYLVTIHRAENTDAPQRLRAIVDALVQLGREARVVFPVHPRTRQVLARCELWDVLARSVELVEPVGYVEMLALMRGARAVLTDSGGVQKEAYFVGTPCVTLRDETEWRETVELGWNTLVTDLAVPAIVAAARAAAVPPPSELRPYGDGRAADRIAEYLHGMLQAR